MNKNDIDIECIRWIYHWILRRCQLNFRVRTVCISCRNWNHLDCVSLRWCVRIRWDHAICRTLRHNWNIWFSRRNCSRDGTFSIHRRSPTLHEFVDQFSPYSTVLLPITTNEKWKNENKKKVRKSLVCDTMQWHRRQFRRTQSHQRRQRQAISQQLW